MTLLSELIDMHTYCRPAGSATERAFIAKYVAPLPGAYMDQHNNWHVAIGDSRILWSCHTDTVHRSEGRQTLHYDCLTATLGLSHAAKRHGSNCLGADDTAGVFICRQMILAGIPGHYVFHYGEECGGIGSGDLARYEADWLASLDYAVAFDRRGTQDIVTHQWSSRTCSDLFALSMSEAITATGLALDYRAHEGIYTDTAEYAGLIKECSNLSVGYQNEHTQREVLNVAHVLTLLQAMCSLDHSLLITDRDPSIVEYEDWGYGNSSGGSLAGSLATINEYNDPQFDSGDCCADCGHELWDDGSCMCRPARVLCLVCDKWIDERPHVCVDPAKFYLSAEYAEVQEALRKASLNRGKPTNISHWRIGRREGK